MAACTDRQLTQAQLTASYDQQRTGVVRAIRPFSGSPTIENLIDYVNRELGPAVRQSRDKVNEVFKQVADNAPSANPLAYYFSETTTNADPTVGRMRLNQAVQNTATVVRCSQTNGRQQDVTPWLDVMSGGPTSPLGVLTMVDAINPSRFLRFDLNTMVDQGAYWDLGVTIVESSTASPFVDGEPVVIGFIAGVSAAGSTIPVGSLSPVAPDTFLGNIGTTTVAPSAVPFANVDSTSIVYNATAHEMQRAPLTGEVTASANANATTITRSTDFQTAPWTGNHQFNGEIRGGTLHTASSASGTLAVTLTAGATRLLISSTADVNLDTITGCADGRLLWVEHTRASGTGNLVVNHDASSANAIACPGNRPYLLGNRGGFFLLGRQGASANWKLVEADPYTGDTLTETGGGTFNDYALPADIKVLNIGTLNATLTGFARAGGNIDGDRFWIRSNDAITATLAQATGSIAGNQISCPKAVNFVAPGRCMVELRYEGTSWRVIGMPVADVFAASVNTFTAANTFSSTVALGASVTFTGSISPTALSADQNNYTPTGWSTANLVRLSTNSATTRQISGAAAGASGELKWLVNIGPGTITLLSEDAGSSAANRFVLTSGTTFGIVVNGVLGILYDGTSSRWRPTIPNLII